ncbi:MAG: NAD(P)/FAD-dependent oxidoreductase, partial [Bacteroidetes bacterium]|nr:NAD(P)/FAD-dependent oxidoreductase [Bacteroidota bacterium]
LAKGSLNFANPEHYPPLVTGMRGSTDASYQYAHALAWGAQKSLGNVCTVDDVYDLVVVGAGISGLAAAYFYQKEYGKDKKILILDNHDDFGGHARRNEFNINGQTYLSYGGSQSIENPSKYSRVAGKLLKDLTIDIPAFDKYFDTGFYKRHNLSPVSYFNKREYGEDKIIKFTFGDYGGPDEGLEESKMGYENAVNQMPLSAEGKKQLKNLIEGSSKKIRNPKGTGRLGYSRNTSYIDYVKQQFGITDPQLLNMLRLIGCASWGMGTDSISIIEAILTGAPGAKPYSLIPLVGKIVVKSLVKMDPYIHHFPDGNASIARLLVRKMIPEVAEGNNAEDVVMSHFNYGKLDQPHSNVRLRLNSTVIEAKHDGGVKNASQVLLNYIKNGQTYQVKARHCVMAGYNMMIPHLVPDLPQEQKDALKQQVKTPLVYSTIMLNNWRALKDLGIAEAYCPGNMHQTVLLDFPVSMGKRKFPESPDEPMAMTMIYIPMSKEPGIAPKAQFKEGRYKLLSTPYAAFENEITEHLNGMLGPAGFNAEKDIHAITVNRWSHGYAYGGSEIHDPDMSDFAQKARKPFGRIVIANSDAGADAYASTAIDQAWRAVSEL